MPVPHPLPQDSLDSGGACVATRLEVLTDRQTEWDVRLDMVNNARRFLLLTTYYFGSDQRGQAMVEALTAAARRGVRVVLVIDRFGQRLARNLCRPVERQRLVASFDALKAAGGQIVFTAPRSFRHRLVGGGLHVKIQVSEAGAAVFGSSNLADESFTHWNEVSLQLEGPIAAHLLREACDFANLDADETATLVQHLAAPPTPSMAYRLRYVREDPEPRSGRLFPFGTIHNRLTQELVRLIDGARRSLCISSMYCKPAPVLKDAILRACERGVEVEIFHSHRDSLTASHVPWISASVHYRSLLLAGVRVYEKRAGQHAKVLLADDSHVAIGSYNLEHAAHDRLIEAMVFSDDHELCGRIRTIFQGLRRQPDNHALTPTWLSELPLQLQVKRWLFRPLHRWI